MSKIIAIGCDHAGFELKKVVVKYLESVNYEVKDFGTNSADSVDYPDMVHPVGKLINDGGCKLGIVICGSANGVNITVNKYDNVRSALCWIPEIAQLARSHNDANILALPARFISEEVALEIVKTFLNTEFEGGRHLTRVEKISKKL